MSVEVRILRPGDEHVLERVAPDVFDNRVDPELSAEFLADPRHHLAVALDGNTVVGMASAEHYIHPDKPAELWIMEIGVASEYQRSGIGRRLFQALFARGRELGCREAWVGTEYDNHAARGLYEAMGGQAERFVLYAFKLSEDVEA